MPINDVKFSKTASKVVVEGKAAPNATVKVENLSVAPFKSDYHSDTFATAKADAKGHFRVVINGSVEGDKVKVSQGDASQIVTVKTGGKDTRRAEFNVQSLRLADTGDGSYGLTTVSANACAGEPGELLQLKNNRTKQTQKVTLDDKGWFPPGFKVAGQPGDVITFASSDGVNNANFKDTCGNVIIPARRDPTSLKVPFEPPAQLEDQSKVKTAKITGPLFVDGASPTDPVQGQIGDCYLVATAASIAQMKPDVLEKMIKDNGDGTYTVTFKRFDAQAKAYVDDAVTVSNQMNSSWSGAFYGGSSNSSDPAKAEAWFPVLEKAYASWKGGFDAIRSGYPYEIFEACLGKAGTHFDVRVDSEAKVFGAMKKAMDAKQPMVAWTGIDSTDKPFTNTGLIGDHAYTIMGVEEKNGERFVKLRNPWGQTEPAGNGPDDGVFSVPWKTFAKYYDGVGVAQ